MKPGARLAIGEVVLEVVRWRPVSVLRPATIVGLVAIAVLVLLFMTTAVLLLLNI